MLEQYRPELTGYCYRMLGSPFDADDAVQETLVRAWQAYDRFEGRSSLRSWLYRIATNVCLDSLRAGGRRALPMDPSSPVPSTTVPGDPLPEATWIGPMRDEVVGLSADRAVLRDSIRLAFNGRAAGTTVAAVNSALQRARATMGELDTDGGVSAYDLGDAERALLVCYVQAFEDYDIDALVQLLHADASISMPPLALWLRGVPDLRGWYLGHGIGCQGSGLVPLTVNGSPGFAQYRPDLHGGHRAWSVQVLEITDGRIGPTSATFSRTSAARFSRASATATPGLTPLGSSPPQPPAMAPMMRKGSCPRTTASGSGSSGWQCGRSSLSA